MPQSYVVLQLPCRAYIALPAAKCVVINLKQTDYPATRCSNAIWGGIKNDTHLRQIQSTHTYYCVCGAGSLIIYEITERGFFVFGFRLLYAYAFTDESRRRRRRIIIYCRVVCLPGIPIGGDDGGGSSGGVSLRDRATQPSNIMHRQFKQPPIHNKT